MTYEEASKLITYGKMSAPKVVTIKRADSTWRGRVVGVVPSPSLVLEVDGRNVTIVLDGAEVISHEH